jgi:aminopeptidase N
MRFDQEGATTRLVRRADYAAPAYFIDTVDLSFDLDPDKTRVLNRMRVRRNAEVEVQPLRLDGEELNLARVLVDGKGCSFRMDGDQLVLDNLPEAFDLEIFTTCAPSKNTQLMGLFVSQGTFFTQCEAEGFRRITYFLDRPDVMSIYTVTLRANKAFYPVLLSNGNLSDSGDLEDGRHFATWHDPHRKPSYLFALVAGQLVCREQRVRAASGSEHLLQIYVRAGDLDKTEHAMRSLMASIAWDEARFNLPLDLERFMIVATSDFNMGAMENKGLNIFNTKLLLASPSTATDVDFQHVESVVAHEYFHNWTGNRVTCRDWFQLSLKEGLTVFRDQEFSQDMAGSPSAAAVRRIEDVRLLRAVQFPEDAGPMAHPVRPDQYEEINNFYTVTIYEKGAEVVRMMQTLVGRDGFARGMAEYFKRHDGQAVTCDDFAQAIADTNPESPLAQHLAAFKRWYAQAGTPRIGTSLDHDLRAETLTLTLRQRVSAPGHTDQLEPMVVPLRLGLIGADGQALPVRVQGDASPAALERTLVMSEMKQSWTLEGVPAGAVPSVLRGFSAPVILEMPFGEAQWLHILAHDSDPFNRWEASQRVAVRRALNAIEGGGDVDLGEAFIAALRAVLRDPQLDAGFKELVLTLPSESYLAEQINEVDPQRIHAVRQALLRQMAECLHDDWLTIHQAYDLSRAYAPNSRDAGERALANLALAQIVLHAEAQGDRVWPGKALQRFKDANNMTDRVGALNALLHTAHPLATHALQAFYQQYRHDPLALDKWFALQASQPDHDGHVLGQVKQLLAHPDFSLKNPNRARSVLSTFCQSNPAAFHRADAGGYVLWADHVLELDSINPQIAARLARALDRWAILAAPYRGAAQEALKRVSDKAGLSADVREIITRALQAAPAPKA